MSVANVNKNKIRGGGLYVGIHAMSIVSWLVSINKSVTCSMETKVAHAV